LTKIRRAHEILPNFTGVLDVESGPIMSSKRWVELIVIDWI